MKYKAVQLVELGQLDGFALIKGLWIIPKGCPKCAEWATFKFPEICEIPLKYFGAKFKFVKSVKSNLMHFKALNEALQTCL